MKPENKGLWLGLLGVVLFAFTLPMTKLATGSAEAPQLSPWFVTFGRAALAGLLSLAWLGLRPGARPVGRQWGLLALNACGVVVGFPLCLALGLRHVPSVHASVVVGIMPLATAVMASLWLRQRPSRGFWACALAGTALVVAFVLLRAGGGVDTGGSSATMWMADGWLLLAVLLGAFGYVSGAQLTSVLGAERAICWVLVLSLPLSLPVTWLEWPTAAQPITMAAWGGFAYVGLVSMWLGFFAWYRGMALGGTVRVSQVQLVQPFLAMLFSVPLLGEALDAQTVLFALAVIATVFVGKRMPVGAPPPAAPPSTAPPSTAATVLHATPRAPETRA